VLGCQHANLHPASLDDVHVVLGAGVEAVHTERAPEVAPEPAGPRDHGSDDGPADTHREQNMRERGQLEVNVTVNVWYNPFLTSTFTFYIRGVWQTLLSRATYNNKYICAKRVKQQYIVLGSVRFEYVSSTHTF